MYSLVPTSIAVLFATLDLLTYSHWRWQMNENAAFHFMGLLRWCALALFNWDVHLCHTSTPFMLTFMGISSEDHLHINPNYPCGIKVFPVAVYVVCYFACHDYLIVYNDYNEYDRNGYWHGPSWLTMYTAFFWSFLLSFFIVFNFPKTTTVIARLQSTPVYWPHQLDLGKKTNVYIYKPHWTISHGSLMYNYHMKGFVHRI